MKIKAKSEEKLEEERAKLLKIQSGKKSLGQIFSKKTKEENIAKAENDIKHLEEEIESMSIILSVTTARLINDVISSFKENKIYRFEATIRTFTESSIKEFSAFINEAKHLESNLSS